MSRSRHHERYHDDQREREEEEDRVRRHDERRNYNHSQWQDRAQAQTQAAAASVSDNGADFYRARLQSPVVSPAAASALFFPREFVSIVDGPANLGVQLMATGGSGSVYALDADARHVIKVMPIHTPAGMSHDMLNELDVYAHLSAHHLACMRRASIEVETKVAAESSGKLFGNLVFFMPRAQYGDLRRYITKLRLRDMGNEARLDDLLAQMLRSVETLHSHHLVHADLKPDNFLVFDRPDGVRLQLVDFGRCAQALPTITPRKAYKGWNRAPEVWRNEERAFGFPAEVYALGCLIFELVCGGSLFQYKATWDVHRQDVEATTLVADRRKFLVRRMTAFAQASPPPPQSPRCAQLVDLLSGMLEPDWRKRITLSTALSHPFFKHAQKEEGGGGGGMCRPPATLDECAIPDAFWRSDSRRELIRDSATVYIGAWCIDFRASVGVFCTAVCCLERALAQLDIWIAPYASQCHVARTLAYACAYVAYKIHVVDPSLDDTVRQGWIREMLIDVEAQREEGEVCAEEEKKQPQTPPMFDLTRLLVQGEVQLVHALQGRINMRYRADSCSSSAVLTRLVEASQQPGRLTSLFAGRATIAHQLGIATGEASASASASAAEELTCASRFYRVLVAAPIAKLTLLAPLARTLLLSSKTKKEGEEREK